MKKGQAHPAALTSKKMILAALLALIEEKGYRGITITEVCERSQVARRTFYRNFETVEDVLEFAGKSMISEFAAEMRPHAGESYRSVLAAYFAFWNRYAATLDLLSRNGLTHILFIAYIKCLPELPFLCPDAGARPDGLPYVMAYAAGGLWSVLTFHIANGSKKTPEELAEILTG